MTEHARRHAYATAAEVADYMRISRKSFARHVAPTLVGVEVGARSGRTGSETSASRAQGAAAKSRLRTQWIHALTTSWQQSY